MVAVRPPGQPGRYAAHPGFARAVADYAEGIIANFGTPSVIGRLMALGLSDSGAPTISDLARGFGVSRGHVRNLVVDADRIGLIRFDGPARLIEPTPHLVAAFDAWIDRMLTFIADHADDVAPRHGP